MSEAFSAGLTAGRITQEAPVGLSLPQLSVLLLLEQLALPPHPHVQDDSEPGAGAAGLLSAAVRDG